MSNPLYDEIGHPILRLKEECAELILALCKAERFGYYSYNPSDEDEKSNLEAIFDEMDDVKRQIVKVTDYLLDLIRKNNT
jgi:hypothetical protein